MRTGVSYLGHYSPKHIELDVMEMKKLRLDDMLLAAQENDFVHFPGKLEFSAKIAADYGIRPIAIFWGALNLFGGGRSSQFLLENPGGLQVTEDGSHSPAGCYVNTLCRARIQEMIDVIARRGFGGYFIDEPTPLRECYCPSCRAKYEEWYGGDLGAASAAAREEFRQRCVVDYVSVIARYCKTNHPRLETLCCLMPQDDRMWEGIAGIPDLDNFGTDIYWVNEDRNVEDMTPIVRNMAGLCQRHRKKHHEWLQCWGTRSGREPRIADQGKVLLRERPDTLYVWAWKAQEGTAESCEDPVAAWGQAENILRAAKER